MELIKQNPRSQVGPTSLVEKLAVTRGHRICYGTWSQTGREDFDMEKQLFLFNTKLRAKTTKWLTSIIDVQIIPPTKHKNKKNNKQKQSFQSAKQNAVRRRLLQHIFVYMLKYIYVSTVKNNIL